MIEVGESFESFEHRTASPSSELLLACSSERSSPDTRASA